MLLKLVELRSSDWGRVRDAAAASNATPDNDPNYFMVGIRIFSAVPSVTTVCVFLGFFLNLFFTSLLRMNLRSTQKMALLSQPQIQVRTRHVQQAAVQEPTLVLERRIKTCFETRTQLFLWHLFIQITQLKIYNKEF